MRIRDLARNSSFVAGGSLATAVAGLAFRTVVVARFGASAETDALVLAIQVVDGITAPTSAVVVAAIPVLARVAAGDADLARAVTRALIGLMSALFLLLALGVAVLADPVAHWLVGRPEPDAVALTAGVVRWLSASVVLFGVTGLLIALAQRDGDFLTPASVLPLRSVGAVVGIALGASTYGIVGAALGFLAGGLVQASVLAARVAPKVGRGPVAWSDPAVSEIARLSLPMVLGAVLVQLNPIVSMRYAAALGHGQVTEFNYASAIAALAAGLVGPSLADASFPHLAAATGAADRGAARRQIATVLQSALIVGGALSVALFVLAPDVLAVIFGMGRLPPESVQRAALVLRVYSAGLLPLILATIAARFLYAFRDGAHAQAIVATALVANVIALGPMTRAFGLAGVALSYVITIGASAVAMLIWLHRRHHALTLQPLLASALRSGLSMAIVGATVWAAVMAVGSHAPARLVAGGAAGGLALAVVVWCQNELGLRDRALAYLARRRPPANPGH